MARSLIPAILTTMSLALSSAVLANEDKITKGYNSMDAMGCMLVRECTKDVEEVHSILCLLYTSPSPRDATLSRMPSSA